MVLPRPVCHDEPDSTETGLVFFWFLCGGLCISNEANLGNPKPHTLRARLRVRKLRRALGCNIPEAAKGIEHKAELKS